MTPQLKAAIAAIRPLNSTERQQLLQLLLQEKQPSDHYPELQTLSPHFWQGYTIPQLRKNQTPTPVRNLNDFAFDFWPDDDTETDFLTFLKQQRHSHIAPTNPKLSNLPSQGLEHC